MPDSVGVETRNPPGLAERLAIDAGDPTSIIASTSAPCCVAGRVHATSSTGPSWGGSGDGDRTPASSADCSGWDGRRFTTGRASAGATVIDVAARRSLNRIQSGARRDGSGRLAGRSERGVRVWGLVADAEPCWRRGNQSQRACMPTSFGRTSASIATAPSCSRRTTASTRWRPRLSSRPAIIRACQASRSSGWHETGTIILLPTSCVAATERSWPVQTAIRAAANRAR